MYNDNMKMKRWLELHTRNLRGVRIAITGPTGGLGIELCRYLTAQGASLILLDRNAEKSAALQQDLLSRTPQATLTRIPLDLSDMASVRTACTELIAQQPDILIHNAGAYSIPRYTTDVGLDNVFQINAAAPYYLTRELLPTLRARGGRVVVVGSIAHNYSRTDPADVDFHTRRAASRVYGNAKRRLMFSLYELFRKEKDVTLSVVHPGITFTNITAHYPPWLFALIRHPMKWIFMSPARACLCLLRGVYENTPYHHWIGPRLWNVWGLPKMRRLRTCSNAESLAIAEQMDMLYHKLKET